jgi:Na+/phosphate symporter
MTNTLDTDIQDIPVDGSNSEGATDNNDSTTKETFDNATVQKIVARERHKAYEKGKSEALMDLQQQQEATQEQQQQPAVQSLGGMKQMSPDEIRKLIAEQVPQHLQEQVQAHQQKQLVDSFVNKMTAAEQKYPGLEEKLNLLDYDKPATIALVHMANNLENTGDIMNELLEHPEKMSTIFGLIHEQPRLAMNRLQSLSNSIKQNQVAASENQSVNEPMSQIKSSVNSGMDNHNLSVADLRAMFSR